METTLAPEATPSTQAGYGTVLERWLPLAGVAYAALTIGGDLVVDKFPDENTSLRTLTSYYAAHHQQVGRGGLMMELAAIFVALFGIALAVRVRHHIVAAGVIGIGAATTCLAAAYEGATFRFLGENATDPHLSAQALQAWHTSAAAFGTNVPSVLLVIGLVMAGRALPTWLVAVAVVLVVAQFTPVGFLAGMVMLLWFLVAGIVLALRPAR